MAAYIRDRVKLGFTQSQYAKLLGVERAAYSMCECGKRTLPRQASLREQVITIWLHSEEEVLEVKSDTEIPVRTKMSKPEFQLLRKKFRFGEESDRLKEMKSMFEVMNKVRNLLPRLKREWMESKDDIGKSPEEIKDVFSGIYRNKVMNEDSFRATLATEVEFHLKRREGEVNKEAIILLEAKLEGLAAEISALERLLA